MAFEIRTSPLGEKQMKLRYALTTLLIAGIASAANSQVTILHKFGRVFSDGWFAGGSLTVGPDGSFYGTTLSGGEYGGGIVYKLSPPSVGDEWDETILHNFGGENDGSTPDGALVFDGAGNLYGTCLTGNHSPGLRGNVFSIAADGSYSEYLFVGPEGMYPNPGIVLLDGLIYGTTQQGGANNSGTIWSISTDMSGIADLYDFAGATPMGGIVSDGAAFYGVTNRYVFGYNGSLTEMHLFQPGWTPNGQLLISGGTLYGMTASGGHDGHGMVYTINTDSTGYKMRHSFKVAAPAPWAAGLSMATNGTLYGVVTDRAFSLTPNSGRWKYAGQHAMGKRQHAQSLQPTWAGLCGVTKGATSLANAGEVYCLTESAPRR
jgi:uncharacterized repeat protein (TIGR03803 family)